MTITERLGAAFAQRTNGAVCWAGITTPPCPVQRPMAAGGRSDASRNGAFADQVGFAAARCEMWALAERSDRAPPGIPGGSATRLPTPTPTPTPTSLTPVLRATVEGVDGRVTGVDGLSGRGYGRGAGRHRRRAQSWRPAPSWWSWWSRGPAGTGRVPAGGGVSV